VIVTDGKHLDNLRRAIDSCQHVPSETLIVYQGTDAEVYGAIQGLSTFSIQVSPKGNADPDRNLAYGLASGDFILALDDDEYVTKETLAFISRIMMSNADVVWFNFKNLVDGVDIKRILGDDPHPRFWRRRDGLIEWPSRAHTYPKINSPNQIITSVEIVHDRKFDELNERHEKRIKADPSAVELEGKFIAALKQLLGKK
jgi:glycosyltransferase involved in cell wall biosynthesis